MSDLDARTAALFTRRELEILLAGLERMLAAGQALLARLEAAHAQLPEDEGVDDHEH